MALIIMLGLEDEILGKEAYEVVSSIVNETFGDIWTVSSLNRDGDN